MVDAKENLLMSQTKYPIRKSQLVISNGPGQIINLETSPMLFIQLKIGLWSGTKGRDKNGLKIMTLIL